VKRKSELLMLFLLILARNVWSGVDISGGGDVLICFKDQYLIKNKTMSTPEALEILDAHGKKAVKSVVTLDYFEASQLNDPYGQGHPDLISHFDSYDELLEILEIQLTSARGFFELIKKYSEDLHPRHWRVIGRLKDIQDSQEVFFPPKNCAIVQAVVRQLSAILYDPFIWSLLNQTQKSFLRLHEAIYAIGKVKFGHKTSANTRLLIARLFKKELTPIEIIDDINNHQFGDYRLSKDYLSNVVVNIFKSKGYLKKDIPYRTAKLLYFNQTNYPKDKSYELMLKINSEQNAKKRAKRQMDRYELYLGQMDSVRSEYPELSDAEFLKVWRQEYEKTPPPLDESLSKPGVETSGVAQWDNSKYFILPNEPKLNELAETIQSKIFGLLDQNFVASHKGVNGYCTTRQDYLSDNCPSSITLYYQYLNNLKTFSLTRYDFKPKNLTIIGFTCRVLSTLRNGITRCGEP